MISRWVLRFYQRERDFVLLGKWKKKKKRIYRKIENRGGKDFVFECNDKFDYSDIFIIYEYTLCGYGLVVYIVWGNFVNISERRCMS